jgi:hypothetical protein
VDELEIEKKQVGVLCGVVMEKNSSASHLRRISRDVYIQMACLNWLEAARTPLVKVLKSSSAYVEMDKTMTC